MCPGGCHNNPYTLFQNAGGCNVQWQDIVYVFGGMTSGNQENQLLYAYNTSGNTLNVISTENVTKVCLCFKNSLFPLFNCFHHCSRILFVPLFS